MQILRPDSRPANTPLAVSQSQADLRSPDSRIRKRANELNCRTKPLAFSTSVLFRILSSSESRRNDRTESSDNPPPQGFAIPQRRRHCRYSLSSRIRQRSSHDGQPRRSLVAAGSIMRVLLKHSMATIRSILWPVVLPGDRRTGSCRNRPDSHQRRIR